MSDMYLQAQSFGAQFLIDTVQSLSRKEWGWCVTCTKGEVFAKALILATGLKHKTLNIPGEKEFVGRGVSYCASCDGPFFKGKKIIVVGGGDSACDEAHYLAGLTDTVILIHRRSTLKAQGKMAERILSNKNIEVRFNTVLLEIRGDKNVRSVVLEEGGARYEESADAVFVFIGATPSSPFIHAACERDGEGYILTDQNMESSLPGLFVAGDLCSSPFKQVITACAQGSVAARRAAGRQGQPCTP